jgi:hypothetical protein
MTHCVRVITHIDIERQLSVVNLVLLKPCDFSQDSVVSPFVVIRQSWDILRFARTDGLFLTSRPRVKPIKDLSQIDETFTVYT